MSLAILVTAEVRAAEPPANGALAKVVRLWRAAPGPDLRHLEPLRTLAARGPVLAASGPGSSTLVVRPGMIAEGRAWPLRGWLVGRFTETADPLTGAALTIRAFDGAEVLAPARGRVVFGDRLDGVGLVLIIDHGDEYHSVLAGLGDLDVEAGSEVRAGQRVGHMAAAVDATELHVELRRHGRPIDPLPWLGVIVKGDG